MTVLAQNIAVGYTGNGVTTVFAYPFRILDATYLKVYLNGVLQTVGYAVSNVDATLGGNVTFAVAPANGAALLFQRVTLKTQEVDYTPYDAFPSETHERALDKLTQLVQESSSGADHSIRIPAGEDTSVVITTLPAPAARFGQFVTFDVLGNVTVGLPGNAPVSVAWQPVVNAATIALGRAQFTPLTTKGDLWAFGAADTRMPAGTDNQALLADSSAANGLRYVTLGAGATRQSVLSSALDANGYAAGITTGAGLRPGLDAAPTPMTIAFAAGFGQQGAMDLVSTLSADVADPLGADLKLNNTAFVHATYTSPAAVAWAACYVPPDYAYTFDRTRGALLNFEAADATVAMIDDFGNTWTAVGNAQIDTAQFKFGTSSLLLDGTGDYITSNSITTCGDGSWEMSFWFRLAVAPTAGNSFTFVDWRNAGGFGLVLNLNNNAGTIKTNLYVSSDGTTQNVANAVLGANTVWALNQWNRFRIVFDALGGTYRVYLSLNGAAETQDTSVASSARLCAFSTARIGADNAGGGSVNGWIDAFRFIRAATNTATETPGVTAPAIGDYPYHFFSIPEMKMYEATAASAVAGTNPALTARNRCFIAESDTSGAAVTAVRNYALRGKYVADIFTAGYGVSTFTSKNHNIGVKPDYRAVYVCVSPDFGWAPGDEVPMVPNYFDGANSRSWGGGVDRNVVTFCSSTAAAVIPAKNAATINVIVNGLNWKVRLYCDRRF